MRELKIVFAVVRTECIHAEGGLDVRDLFAAVHPRPMTTEDWTAIHQRRRRLRHRLRLRVIGVGRAGWIAVGVLVALWTVAILT